MQETNKSSIAKHILETNHGKEAVKLLKYLINNPYWNVPDPIEISNNRNNLGFKSITK